MTLKATSIVRAQYLLEKPWVKVPMDSLERQLRRRVITLQDGAEVLVDLEKPVKLEDRDCLVLEDGRLLQIVATDEDLMEVRAQNTTHLMQLAWHIGNRHLEAQIERERILLRRDQVIAHMLEQRGASLKAVREPFSPERGAYAHGH
jgi:urease accessory protein